MARYGRRDTKYGRNPPPPRHMRFGRKVMDQQTSFWTYEDKLVQDETGLWVDPNFGGYDTDEQKDFTPLR